MDIGTQVRVKWGKKKQFFPGSIGGIEYLNNYHVNSPMTVFSDNQSQHSCSLSNSVNDTPQDLNSSLSSIPTQNQDQPSAAQSSAHEQTPSNLHTTARPTCITCSGVFRPQYRPITCAHDNCTTLVHKQLQCSGLNRDQQQNSINWKCTAHGGSGPQPNSLAPSPASVNGQCPVCNVKFRVNLSPLVCKSCSKGIHVSCSGLDRWNAQKARRQGSWECSECLGEQQTQASAPQPADLPKGKCYKCKRAICVGKRRAKCCSCSELFHRGCTGLTKDSMDPILNANNWSCDTCQSKGKHPTSLPNQTSEAEKHEPKHTGPTASIKVLQWNADGLNPKIAELGEFVKKHQVDVALIQETKLTKDKPTPKLYGYTAVRADRPDAQFPGGGLITYIKHNIAFRKIGSAKNGCVEAMSVSVQQQAKKWLDLTNVYVPPGSRESNDVSWLPANSTCIIAGDFNGHSKLWDPNQPSDKMGENVVDLVLANNLFCCNDGSPTRINRGTGGLSAPDVTLASTNLNNKITWTSIDDLGSDHMPIILEIKNEYTRRHVKGRRRKRWRRLNVDWGGFTHSIETKLDKAKSESNDQNATLKDRVTSFNSTLLAAGKEHVGKTNPRTRDCWMNPAVRTALKKRNLLRREVRAKRQEWLEACEEAQNLVNEAKHKAWEDYLSEVEFSADPCDMWRVIRSLSGTPDSMAPNEALIVNGKVITTNPKKAEAFAKLYAGVSKLTFSKQERSRNRKLQVRMRNLIGPDDESCRDFDPKELQNALKAMKTNGAPGADDIPPSFLKNLGPLATKELLNILNTSFRTGVIPRIWRHAIIIPLLKSGKPSSQLSSYRPISLTSCVVKLLERMICARLYHIAESNGWICKTQAGFRRNQSTEDQVLRITQKISDGFQAKPARRTVLAMLDYSKAYDRVWRQELIHEMIDKGVPSQMIRWFRAFLQDRTAQVLYNGALSKKVFLRQGLPQGAVSSPLLFLFYIDSLNDVIPEGTDIALFADDASVWAADIDLNRANRKVQSALEKVEAWSKSKKMDLNVQKSEATFFSPATNEAKWRPSLCVNKLPIPFNPTPKFLGIHLD